MEILTKIFLLNLVRQLKTYKKEWAKAFMRLCRANYTICHLGCQKALEKVSSSQVWSLITSQWTKWHFLRIKEWVSHQVMFLKWWFRCHSINNFKDQVKIAWSLVLWCVQNLNRLFSNKIIHKVVLNLLKQALLLTWSQCRLELNFKMDLWIIFQSQT